jgi:hypothetical protein
MAKHSIACVLMTRRPTLPSFTLGHALLIGVGTYQNSAWSAPITVADAQGLADALSDPTVSAYPPDQVTLVHDQEATCAGATTALQQLAERTTATDTVVIFFCGHGGLGTDGVYYFATHETVFVGQRIQAGTGLATPDLLALLRAISAQKLLFIINACFSGHLSPTLGTEAAVGAPPSATLGIDILATGEGRAIITASRPTQFSVYMPDAPHTFFGQALIDGLRGQAANSGGYIGLYELYQNIYASVKAAAAGVSRQQEPVLTVLQGVGPFPVAFYPGATSGDLGTAPLQQTLPPNAAVEVVPKTIVQAIGHRAHAFNISSGGGTKIDQSRKLIDFGRAQIQGSVSIGDVAGRDMIKVNVSVADAAAVDTKQDLLDLIGKLQANVAALKDVPEGDREDAEDALRRAREGGEKGDKTRMIQKLESAQKIMVALGGTIPAAFELGKSIGTLIQRAIGL